MKKQLRKIVDTNCLSKTVSSDRTTVFFYLTWQFFCENLCLFHHCGKQLFSFSFRENASKSITHQFDKVFEDISTQGLHFFGQSRNLKRLVMSDHQEWFDQLGTISEATRMLDTYPTGRRAAVRWTRPSFLWSCWWMICGSTAGPFILNNWRIANSWTNTNQS